MAELYKQANDALRYREQLQKVVGIDATAGARERIACAISRRAPLWCSPNNSTISSRGEAGASRSIAA